MQEINQVFQEKTQGPEIQNIPLNQPSEQSKAEIKTIYAVYKGNKHGVQDLFFEVLVPDKVSIEETLSDTWEALLGKRTRVEIRVQPKNQ